MKPQDAREGNEAVEHGTPVATSQTPTYLETGGRNALNLQTALDALKWALDTLDDTDAYLRKVDSENYEKFLNLAMDRVAKAKARHAIECLQSAQAASDSKKCLSENGPKSEGAASEELVFTYPRKGLTTEDCAAIHSAVQNGARCIVFKAPSDVDGPKSSNAVGASSPNPSPSPSEANAQGMEHAKCTLCAKVESPGFFTGCMIRDTPKSANLNFNGWSCDGNGNLSRPLPSTIKEQPENKDLGKPEAQ